MNGKIDLKRLYRYDHYSKSYHIDIHIDYYRDVYNEWDYSPIHNRDLDEDLLTYLLECSYEIPMKYRIAIDFFLPNTLQNQEREKRSIDGMKNFFQYQIRKNKMNIKSKIKNTFLYLVVGFSLLVGAYLIQNYLTDTFLQNILPEGLLIGAWVLIWEIFSIIFFEISRFKKTIKHYKRLLNSNIVYHY